MATKKAVKTNKQLDTIAPETEEQDEEDEGEVMSPKKSVKPIVEIDAADILPEVDEKVEDENIALDLDDEDSEDLPSLDEDDLNPFGDKWEQ